MTAPIRPKLPALALSLVCLAPPALAQSPLDDPQVAARVLVETCVSGVLDFQGIFATGKGRAAGAGLAAVMETDKIAMYGHPVDANVMFSREIDSIACALTLKPPAGSKAYYEALRDRVEEIVTATYPGALSVDGNLPSPHEEQYSWAMNIPKDRNLAASLTWDAEDGVLLGIGFRQIYE